MLGHMEKLMKRTVFIILWMFVFLIFHVAIWFGGILLWANPLQARWSEQTTHLIIFLDRLGLIGLPSLALILGISGVLPGTRKKEHSVKI
jgi:hypothetical protein